MSLPRIDAAREETAAKLVRLCESLAHAPEGEGVSTCVFGSWARGELTEGSDDDWAVLVADRFAPYEPRVTHEIVLASDHLGQDDRKPGAQAVFGVPFSVDELVTNIGLDADTNTNLTRRMLVLLESREVHGVVREEAIARILDRYLKQGAKPRRVPRFLLNDLVRYWRTICVDFEGKAATGGVEADPKWALRNAKLRTSRKLLFAGGLVTVLLCERKETVTDMHAFLAQWFDDPPLDRLAAAFSYGIEADPGLEDVVVRTFMSGRSGTPSSAA